MTQFWDRPLIYLAGPYTNPDPVVNTRDTIIAAERLHESGLVTCHVPHLSLLWHIVAPHDVNHRYDYDMAALCRCDAILRLPGASSGADNEVAFARSHGIPLYMGDNAEPALLENVRRGWLKKGYLVDG